MLVAILADDDKEVRNRAVDKILMLRGKLMMMSKLMTLLVDIYQVMMRRNS